MAATAKLILANAKLTITQAVLQKRSLNLVLVAETRPQQTIYVNLSWSVLTNTLSIFTFSVFSCGVGFKGQTPFGQTPFGQTPFITPLSQAVRPASSASS